jgi:prepilin peptidase CpaA
MSWIDVRTYRVPNFLTMGGALGGLGFQLGAHGWAGLSDGVLGLLLGLGLLMLPYLLGGMGAGDVKALAALGAWLGPTRTLYLFIYMGISGGLLVIVVLWWRGLLWAKIRQLGVYLWNRLLCRPFGSGSAAASGPPAGVIPYGAAMALGMVILFCYGP